MKETPSHDLERKTLVLQALELRRWLLPVLLSLAVLVPGCGNEDDDGGDGGNLTTPAPPPPNPFVEDSLLWRRGDGSVIEMGDSSITCCGVYDPGFINEPVIRIIFYDPTLQKQSWMFLLLTGATTPGSVHTLPEYPVSPHKESAVKLFAHFGEYSSQEEEASGTITVHSYECHDSWMSVDFSADAALESETMHGSTITVQGRFRAVFTGTPCEP